MPHLLENMFTFVQTETATEQGSTIGGKIID